MYDVRKDLGVASLRLKVEKRVLERIGHVFRMEDDRMTKACVLGWMEELENHEKAPGRSKKTVPYWKKLIREAGMDPTDMEWLTKDRKIWKGKVSERIKHLRKWEESKGKRWSGEVVDRNEIHVNVEVYDCRVCGRVCKSKAGLVNHRRRMHEESKVKKKFVCEKCGKECKKASELKNHGKVCGGAVASSSDRVKCVCGSEYARTYFRKQRKTCAAWQGQQVEEVARPAAARGQCPDCGKEMRKDNLARHKREACR